MTDTTIVYPVVSKVLQSMKSEEKITASIKPEYVAKHDTKFIEDFKDLYDSEKPLQMDLTLHKLVRVEDLYRDGKVIYKSLRKGQGTASPYSDCYVSLKVCVEIDGEKKF